jgi:GLPGLI family protein
MKKMLMFLLIAIPFFAFAQNKVGKVYYTEDLKLNIEIPEGMDEEMLKMIPKSQTAQRILFFNEEASLYTSLNEDDEEGVIENSSEDGTMRTKMVIMRADNKNFRDLKNNKSVEKRDIFGKAFLIENDIEAKPWKLTGKQKKIGDYPCQHATYTKDTTTIEAWFTPQIPVSVGPGSYTGLPGLVMEAIGRNGDLVIRANKIVLEPFDEAKLVAPTKGKKVTQEEFDKILDEKTKEMGMSRSGSGTVKIRIDRN